jgi:hypothetical protein
MSTIRRVNLDYWPKPIPFRDHDWQATYDGDEPDDDGNMAVGYGATRVEALADLLDNYPRDELIRELREHRKPDGSPCGARSATVL